MSSGKNPIQQALWKHGIAVLPATGDWSLEAYSRLPTSKKMAITQEWLLLEELLEKLVKGGGETSLAAIRADFEAIIERESISASCEKELISIFKRILTYYRTENNNNEE